FAPGLQNQGCGRCAIHKSADLIRPEVRFARTSSLLRTGRAAICGHQPQASPPIGPTSETLPRFDWRPDKTGSRGPEVIWHWFENGADTRLGSGRRPGQPAVYFHQLGLERPAVGSVLILGYSSAVLLRPGPPTPSTDKHLRDNHQNISGYYH